MQLLSQAYIFVCSNSLTMVYASHINELFLVKQDLLFTRPLNSTTIHKLEAYPIVKFQF